MTDRLDSLLASAEQMLASLQSIPDDAIARSLQFGRDIGDIGRNLVLHPELAPKVRDFVERTAPLVHHRAGLSFWVHRAYAAGESRSSDTEDYTRALWMRSQLEFFRDLYRGTVAQDAVDEIETDELDQNLKEWGAEMYLDEIPEGIPPSHVWWHQSLSGK
jgi:hypothetical protein